MVPTICSFHFGFILLLMTQHSNLLWARLQSSGMNINQQAPPAQHHIQTGSHFMIHSFVWTSSRRLLQWQQNASVWPTFTVVHTRSSVLKGSFLQNLVSRDCNTTVRLRTQQCADRSLRPARLLQLLFDASLPWVLICYCINLHV